MFGSIATGVIGQAILVASGIILARALGPEDRGILAVALLIPALVVQLASLGVPSAVTYSIASASASPSGALAESKAASERASRGGCRLTPRPDLYCIGAPEFAWLHVRRNIECDRHGFKSFTDVYARDRARASWRFLEFNALRLLSGALYVISVGGLWAADQVTLVSVTVAVIVTSVLAAVLTWHVARRMSDPDANRAVGSTRSLVSFGWRSLLGSSSPIEMFRLDQLLVGLVLSPLLLGFYVVAWLSLI